MFNKFSLIRLILSVAVLLALTACGDGSDPSSPVLTSNSSQVTSSKMVFTGVNLAGAEFGANNGSIPPYGTAQGWTYIWPTVAEIKYFQSIGMNTVRLPFLWERLQPNLMQENTDFDSTYLNGISGTENVGLAGTVQRIIDAGMYVILDVHNYAFYPLANSASGYNNWNGNQYYIGGTSGPSSEQFAAFWAKLASVSVTNPNGMTDGTKLSFANNPQVIFGLMNEPTYMPTNTWFNDAQAAVTAIRSTTANNLILVPGTCWTGAWSWVSGTLDPNNPGCFTGSGGTGVTNASVMGNIFDPANNYAYDLHQYLDSDYSGTGGKDCTQDGSKVLEAATEWLKDNKARGFLGEFAGINSPACKTAVTNMLNFMNENLAVFAPIPIGSPVNVTTGGWIGWTWWGSTPWGSLDGFSIEPTNIDTSNVQDAPQTGWLKPYF
jgi:endoglucanase